MPDCIDPSLDPISPDYVVATLFWAEPTYVYYSMLQVADLPKKHHAGSREGTG